MKHPLLRTPVVIATRGSQLALWQAQHVQHLLEQQGLSSRLHIVKTTGDRIQDRFLHEIGGKGLFIREIEQALLEGEADIGVHSLKDLPARVDPAFDLGAILPRGPVGDVLLLREAKWDPEKKSPLSKEDVASLRGCRIATGSLRRGHFLTQADPEIHVVPVRGNVDTRLRKLQEGEWEGLIVAEAALHRLPAATGLFSYALDTDWFVPSACQGTLAVETLSEHPIRSILRSLNDPASERGAHIERSILSHLGGDCTLPVGIHYQGTRVTACVLAPNRTESRATCAVREDQTPEEIGALMVEGLLRHGLVEVFRELRLELPA